MARKTSFYYSFLVLPARQRRAIIAVWDFCRAVDDAVDEDGLVESGSPMGRAAIPFWRDELASAFDGGTPASPQGRGLQPHVRPFELPRRAFEDVIDGVAMDLDTMRYETFDDLLQYCRRVASAVGLICIRIFGCTSESVDNGAAAVEAAASGRFDLVLMDVKMPGMDGIEATRRIRSGGGPWSQAPILAVTANADPADAAFYRASGMNGVVEKPLKPERLLAAMSAVLQMEEGSADEAAA